MVSVVSSTTKAVSFLGMSAITRSRESAECRLLLCLFIESKACDSSPVARVGVKQSRLAVERSDGFVLL